MLVTNLIPIYSQYRPDSTISTLMFLRSTFTRVAKRTDFVVSGVSTLYLLSSLPGIACSVYLLSYLPGIACSVLNMKRNFGSVVYLYDNKFEKKTTLSIKGMGEMLDNAKVYFSISS